MGNISKIICCSLFISTCLYAQIHISGPLSGILVDTVYLVSDDIRVAFGDSLIIWPGATLLFMDTTRFSIAALFMLLEHRKILYLLILGIMLPPGMDWTLPIRILLG